FTLHSRVWLLTPLPLSSLRRRPCRLPLLLPPPPSLPWPSVPFVAAAEFVRRKLLAPLTGTIRSLLIFLGWFITTDVLEASLYKSLAPHSSPSLISSPPPPLPQSLPWPSVPSVVVAAAEFIPLFILCPLLINYIILKIHLAFTKSRSHSTNLVISLSLGAFLFIYLYYYIVFPHIQIKPYFLFPSCSSVEFPEFQLEEPIL
ncbi:hypothetical protein HYC85_012295, partial [Camellia sinensis]